MSTPAPTKLQEILGDQYHKALKSHSIASYMGVPIHEMTLEDMRVTLALMGRLNRNQAARFEQQLASL